MDGEQPKGGTDPRAVIASELRRAMDRKGWSLSETSWRASRFLADGQRLGRAHLWHYIHGAALPRPLHLHALVSALGLEPELIRKLAGPCAGVSQIRRHTAGQRSLSEPEAIARILKGSGRSSF